MLCVVAGRILGRVWVCYKDVMTLRKYLAILITISHKPFNPSILLLLMNHTVISIGGSVLLHDEKTEYISELAEMLVSLSKERRIGIVTGGGWIARYYIKAGRVFGTPEEYLDLMGIDVTRVNARLLITALMNKGADVNLHPPHTVEEAAGLSEKHEIVVMGGTVPGHTTDAVSAMLASSLGAKILINATAVDGVYTADPKKDPDARQIPAMNYEELKAIIDNSDSKGAGPNVVFDPVAADIIERDGIETRIVNGLRLEELKKAIAGERFMGTLIK